MSTDQKIAIAVPDFPQILEFKENGEEIYNEDLLPEDQFLKIWASEQKEDEAKQTANVKAKAFEYIVQAKSYIDSTLVVLKNTPVFSKEMPCFDSIRLFNDIPREETDRRLGTLIVEKQLQLQNSKDKLSSSVESLRETIGRSKEYFRKAESLQHKFRLTKKVPVLSGTPVLALENPVNYPDLQASIFLYFNKEDGDVKMVYSDNKRLSVNNKHYEVKSESDFIDRECILLQNSMFKRMQSESLEELDNYGPKKYVKSVKVKDLEIKYDSFSTEDEKCPFWLPKLALSSIPPNAKPLEKLRELKRNEEINFYLLDFIKSRFAHTDICKVYITYHKECTVFNICSLFSSDSAVVVAKGNYAIVSTPTHSKQPTRIDLSEASGRNRFEHWAHVTWFILFQSGVLAIASMFNFSFNIQKNMFTINCDDRVIDFEASTKPEEAYVIIRKSDKTIRSFLWSFVRGISLEFKVEYLLFGNI